MKRTPLTLAALMAITVTLGGCLVSSSTSSYETGRRVTDETTAQIVPGETTREWLLATLGEPTARTTVEGEEGVEIFRYDWQKREESGGAVFLLFAGSSSKSTRHTTYFEITNGVVTRYWAE